MSEHGVDDGKLSEFESGRAIAVPLPQIERELATLWREAAQAARATGRAQALTRACLWNLVVRVPGETALVRAKRIIDAISSSVPARVLVLETRSDAAAEPVRAWIEANWHRIEGGRIEIGSEEVTLRAAGETVDDLAPVVRALLVPDVPTAALWLGAAPDPRGNLDRELRAAADRLILDGDGAVRGEAPSPWENLAQLHGFVKDRRPPA